MIDMDFEMQMQIFVNEHLMIFCFNCSDLIIFMPASAMMMCSFHMQYQTCFLAGAIWGLHFLLVELWSRFKPNLMKFLIIAYITHCVPL